MTVIVTQLGARHSYAIPRMLYRAGHLEALYTDSCVNRGFARIADGALPSTLRRGRVGQLLQRNVVGVPRDRIFVTDLPALVSGRSGEVLSIVSRRWGLRGASMVYSMFGEALSFLKEAKQHGARIAIDIFITPVAHRVVRAERAEFPDWEADPGSSDDAVERHVEAVLEVADILTCPGQNVVEGLRHYPSFDESKSRLIPYACGFDYGDSRNNPVPGRVLFAGTAELRKGIHYFAMAANILAKQGKRYDFRVAGAVTERVRGHDEARGLNFLGHLAVSVLKEELMRADVLVLPTLAEGSATVVFEALAAGLPVITTASAGSIVTTGEDGLIVPERDAVALAEAIQAVVEDRERRNGMALTARRNRARYTENDWQDRLVHGLGLNAESPATHADTALAARA